MGRFEERIERWIWPALGGLVVTVAAILIIWFPAPRWGEAPEMTGQVRSMTHQDVPQGVLSIEAGNGTLEDVLGEQEIRIPPRDPFLSKAEVKWIQFLEEISMRPPQVEGIVEREGQRFALIKGRLWKAGDRIEGFSIVRVGQEEVELNKEGKTVVVKLKTGGGR